MGTVGHKNKGGGVPGKGPIQGGSLGFQMKGSPYQMSASQENTFGPSGSNPNPGVYSGIKAADANKSGSDVPTKNMDIPLQKKKTYKQFVEEQNKKHGMDKFNKTVLPESYTNRKAFRAEKSADRKQKRKDMAYDESNPYSSGRKVGNVLRDAIGGRVKDNKKASANFAANDNMEASVVKPQKTNAGKAIQGVKNVAQKVGEKISQTAKNTFQSKDVRHGKVINDETGERDYKSGTVNKRVERKKQKLKDRMASRGGKRSDVGQWLKDGADEMLGKKKSVEGNNESSGYQPQDFVLPSDLSSIGGSKSGFSNVLDKDNYTITPTVKLSKDKNEFLKTDYSGGPSMKQPFYKKGPLYMAQVSGDDDNTGDKDKDKKDKEDKEDKKDKKDKEEVPTPKYETQKFDLV